LKRTGLALTLIILAILAAACGGENGGIFNYPTNTPRQPEVDVTEVPSPEAAARAFLTAWQAWDYDRMYALLSSLSRDAQTSDEFAAYYKKVRTAATLRSVDFELTGVTVSPTDAEVTYKITLRTILVGDITRDTRMLMKYQDGGWKVAWDEAAILPELKGGNSLIMYRAPTARGNIYDRNGLALASMADEVVSIGIVSGEIEEEGNVLAVLSNIMGKPRDLLKDKIDYDHPDWYIPIGNISKDDAGTFYGMLMNTPGLRVNPAENTRYYYGGGVASNVVGYISQITAETEERYLELGYAGDELVGQVGIEAWGEEYLAGKPGATLLVVAPTGSTVATLAESDAVPGMSIYTTLDRKLQEKMEDTLMPPPYTGAAVVLRRDTGEVLAMMSSPTYDSNLFNPDNASNQYLQTMIFDNPNNPLLNRATLGQYPLGSVFKVITMASGLESGDFTPQSLYKCNGYFLELGGFTGTDWTIERNMRPHGTVSLVQGLMRSCNPYFWHVGLDLYYKDWRIVPNMARNFGLGSLTGIGVIDEAPGFVPDVDWKVSKGEQWTESDALQQAIGQGELQVTPLQVADFGAAVGNGGTLYQPQLILKIQPPIGDPVFNFQPKVRGKLSVSPDNLAAIQQAMRGVVNDPLGTARHRFYEISSVIKIAGKTGTAQTNFANPDSWFVSYTSNNNPDKPDIATAVLVEYAGEGSTYAAPMTRRIIEIYFYGSPKALYAWEATYGMRGTNTPEFTEEPTATLSP
jgi:penicillin-binding protein 2